jgi:hypothetical protein
MNTDVQSRRKSGGVEKLGEWNGLKREGGNYVQSRHFAIATNKMELKVGVWRLDTNAAGKTFTLF